MTTVGIWVVVLVVTVVIAMIVLGYWVVRRRAAARHRLPPLFYPARPQGAPTPPHAHLLAPVRQPLHRNGATPANGATPTNGVPRADGTPSAKVETPKAEAPKVEPVLPRAAAGLPRPRPRSNFPPLGDDYREGETVRFYRPIEQALQLLPGHLEVLAGSAREREIRFVRVPGDPPHVVLGRDAGPAPNAIGLGSSTVSRRHARMDYVDGHWHVRNLSRTNPLVLNDDLLDDTDGGRLLTDGDRLELGEVVLRFHEH
jgi:hypothetical protein